MADPIILTEALLKSLLPTALVDRGGCMNIDSDMTPGIYTTFADTTGTFPAKMGVYGHYGKLTVFPKRNDNIFQMLIGENGAMATRVYYNGSWQPWKEPVYQ